MNGDILPVGIPEIAEKLGVKRATVDQWIQRNLLPPPDWTVGGRPAWNWVNIRRWAEENGRYREDTMARLDLSQTAASVIAAARELSPFETPAEFDYDIAIHHDQSVNGIGGIYGPLGNGVYAVAAERLPGGTTEEREALRDQLWQELQPELQAYAQRCRDRKYAGWSNAARARGARITYAD